MKCLICSECFLIAFLGCASVDPETECSPVERHDAAVNHLTRSRDPQDITHMYRSDDDNSGAVLVLALMGAIGVLRGLSSLATREPEVIGKLPSVPKPTPRPLAPYRWQGLEESGTNEEYRALGLMAAKTTLRIVKELDMGDLPLARAYWSLGSQYLAAGQFEAARDAFKRSARHARRASVKEEELLAKGYLCVTSILENSTDENAHAELDEIIKALGEIEGGESYIEEINAASRTLR